MRKRESLRFRLSLATAGVALLTVALISLLANVLISRQFRDYIAVRQEQKTGELVSSLGLQYHADTGDWDLDFIHTLGMYALYDGFIIKIEDPAGVPVWDAEHHDMSLCAQVMAEISERMRQQYPRMNGEFVSRDYPLAQGAVEVGTLTISYYGPYFLNESDFQFLSALNHVLLGIGGASLLCAIGVGWLLARRIGSPLARTVEVADRMARGDYAVRLEENSGIGELAALSASVNRLAWALQRQEGLRKRLTQDVAHELRTPLTAVGAHLEAMLEGVWEPTPQRLQACHEEIGRMGKLVRDLESLARVDGETIRLDKSSLDLRELAGEAGEALAGPLAEKGLSLIVEGEAVRVWADRDRLRQVLDNLLMNALKYTSGGGAVRIRLLDQRGRAGFAVEDNGEGIHPEDLPYVFERFYRGDQSRSRATGGAGIGLAIVRSIVEAHGGEVQAASVPGEGSVFTVLLPKGE